jgi:hypothetical protein
VKEVVCTQCGSNSLTDMNGLWQCDFCRTTFKSNREEFLEAKTRVSVGDDIKRLLEMCESDPANRVRYAHLVLDIDPSNQKAIRYL